MHYEPGVPVPKPVKQVKQRPEGIGHNHRPQSMNQEDQLALDVTRGTGIPTERVKMSGANPLKPGDVRSDQRIREPLHRLLLEAKIVEEIISKGRFVLTVKLEWLDKLLKEAEQEHCIPMLVVQFPGDPRRFVVKRFEDEIRLLASHKQLFDDLAEASA